MTKPFPFTDLESNDQINVSGVSMTAAAECNYTAKDLAMAVEEARQETAYEVELHIRTAVATELDHRKIEALKAIQEQLGINDTMVRQWMSVSAITIQSLVKIMGKAIVPKALELQPLADIGNMTHQLLSRLVDQPKIEIRLANELVEQTDGLLKKIAEETGFQGELTTVADPKLGLGDARLVWKNGIADRCLDRIQTEVDIAIDAWFDNQSRCCPPEQTTDRRAGLLEQTETKPAPLATKHPSPEERSIP